MASRIVAPERIRDRNEAPVRTEGRWVLYWMQAAQRAEDNPALEHAVRVANELARPLLVVFGLTDAYPEATARPYRFLLEGLAEVARALPRRGIRFEARRGAPPEVALRFAREAALVVMDRGYLRHQRAWRGRVAREAACRVVEVEGEVVVPVALASDRLETAARTFRPRLRRRLPDFLEALRTTPLARSGLGLELGDLGAGALDLRDPDAALRALDPDRSVPPVPALYRGGTSQAKTTLRRFLDERLEGYAAHRGQPHTSFVSTMGMHLHFGQVSPVYVARAARAAGAGADVEAFLDELLVRRELAVNYVHHAPDRYDRWEGLPGWARATLDAHRGDAREHVYDDDALVAGATHDPWWNAAMVEMRETGYLHNHMRMYWGKRILAWTRAPEAGLERTLRLNNRYLLDGRDPNSYANVAWCYGLHDRPWPERAVFGTVRTMTAGGLRRKADPEAYVRGVVRRVAEVGGDPRGLPEDAGA